LARAFRRNMSSATPWTPFTVAIMTLETVIFASDSLVYRYEFEDLNRVLLTIETHKTQLQLCDIIALTNCIRNRIIRHRRAPTFAKNGKIGTFEIVKYFQSVGRKILKLCSNSEHVSELTKLCNVRA
jgi:hypothetical protein